MTTVDLLRRLDSVRPIAPHRWMALCPAHSDHEPSLSISEADGRTLLRCFAGCETQAVVSSLGLAMADLFIGERRSVPPTSDQVYDYRDEHGTLLFQVVRRVPKSFCQRRPSRQDGWISNLEGVRRVLYRLPELLAADPGELVFVVEGEKDADRLSELGLVVTTNPGGAGKWRKQYSESLQGRRVVAIPDNDDPGRKHARQVVDSLIGVAASVKILDLPSLPEKGDVSDYLDAGHTKEDLLGLAANAPSEETSAKLRDAPAHHSAQREDAHPPRAVSASRRTMHTATELLAMELPEPEWIVTGVLPEGLTLLAGKPKVGKSWLCLQLALAVAGTETDLGATAPSAGDVLYLALEDSTRRLRQRLVALLDAKAAPAALQLAHAWERLPDGGLDSLRTHLRQHPQTRLIVIDTLARVRATNNGRKSAYEIDYGDLAGLQSLASERPGLAILVVHHQRKDTAEDPLDCVSGTTGLTASADTVILMSRGRGTDKFDARMHLVGRDVEDCEFALKHENGSPRWRILGEASGFALSEQQRKIVVFLQALGEPAGPKVIADAIGAPYGSVKHLVGKLVDTGFLNRADSGTYTPNPTHSGLLDHRVHPTHSVHPRDDVPIGESPRFTDASPSQTAQSLGSEWGERSGGESSISPVRENQPVQAEREGQP